MNKWPSYDTNEPNFLAMAGNMYRDNEEGHALVVSLPKLSLHSNLEGFDVFKYKVPFILTHPRKSKETFPWTITSKDLAVFTLFSQKEDLKFKDKMETQYICKPVSWNIYLASTSSHNSPLSKSLASLGIISESSVGGVGRSSPDKIVGSTAMVQEKGAGGSGGLSGKHMLGFVLHMDWSVCDCFVSLRQVWSFQ